MLGFQRLFDARQTERLGPKKKDEIMDYIGRYQPQHKAGFMGANCDPAIHKSLQKLGSVSHRSSVSLSHDLQSAGQHQAIEGRATLRDHC